MKLKNIIKPKECKECGAKPMERLKGASSDYLRRNPVYTCGSFYHTTHDEAFFKGNRCKG